MQNGLARPGDVAVVGIGCVYPGADSPRMLWENVLARRQQFRRMPDARLPLSAYHDADPSTPDKTYGTQAAVLDGFDFDWAGRRIPKTTFEATDLVQWLGLDVALRAIADAGLTPADLPRLTTGAIVGNTLTGEQSRSETLRLRWPFIEKVLRRAGADAGITSAQFDPLVTRTEAYFKSVLHEVTEDTLAGALSNTIAGRICNFLDVRGGGYTVDGACSSSLLAVATAAQFVGNGDWDLGLAGGVDVSLDAFELIGFAKTGALARSGMHVYDRRANGFIPGEGSGFVVLKRLEDARRDGDRVYAIVRGWGVSSDGRGAITAPVGAGQAEALRRAHNKAGIERGELDFIEGHGTGTPAGDRAELEGITLALGSAVPRRCGITSFKSLVGHTKAAAGIGGFIKAVMAVNRRVLPPTAGCVEPNALFEASALTSFPILRGEQRGAEQTLRAGVSGMGFGGINCHVVVESGDAPDERLAPGAEERALMASAQDSEVFAVCADSWPALLERFDAVASEAQGIALGELVDLAAHCNAESRARSNSSSTRVRAALVARSPDDLVRCLQQAREAIASQAPDPGPAAVFQSCWVRAGTSRPRIGFLFPGQGSQQLNAARVLVERFPWARERVHEADAALESFGLGPIAERVFRRLERAAGASELSEWRQQLAQTEVTQPAICLASALWCEWLQRLGVRPDKVAGHSLGELTAFHAAGAFDFRTLIGLAGVRGRAMAADRSVAGTMTSLTCGRTTAEQLLTEVRGYAVLANINSKQQVVASGELAAIEELEQLATLRGIGTRRLQVSNAFHSRLVAGAADALRRESSLPERASASHAWLYSCIDGRRVYPGRALREHFARQLVSPVEFERVVQSVTQDVDLLLEVGPGRVLTGLVAQSESALRCLPIEPEPEQAFDLNRAVAALYVHGVDVRFEQLYEGRLVRPFVPAAERRFFVNPCERPLPELGPLPHSLALPSGLAVDGVSAAELGQYLQQRGGFVADVIRADLRSNVGSPARDHAPVNGDAVPATPAVESGTADRPAPTGGGTAVATAQEPTSAIDLLLELVVRRTSFPLDTLSTEMRLLDDLNLDSIKAGEIIGEAAQRLGAAGALDPAAMANATLQEIASALEAAGGAEASPVVALPAADWVRDFELLFVPEPLPPSDATRLGGKLIEILADEGDGLAIELARRLHEAGARAALTSAAQPNAHADGVIVLCSRDASETTPREMLARAVARLHAAVSKRERPLEFLSFVQFSGGRFATEGECTDLRSCATSGFAASVHLERPGMRIRALDFDPSAAQDFVLERVLLDSSTDDAFASVGYDAEGQRWVSRTRVRPQSPAPHSRPLAAGDVVLVTGGARGVTAACVKALAGRTGAKFALVGTTPVEPGAVASTPAQAEIAETLAHLQAVGSDCRYYCCDVTDASAVGELVARVLDDFGAIDVIVHGAGLNRPARADTVALDSALAEVSPKLLGAAHLVDATRDVPVRAFVALGSIIGVSGMPGNAWYAFSNEGLRAILRRFERLHPERRVTIFDYGVWSDVGMGARLGSTERLSKLGIVGIEPEQGAERFCDLLSSDAPPRELIVTSRFVGLDTWHPWATPKPEGLRFLQDIAYLEPGVEAVVACELSLETDPYLLDHDYQGSYLFPTVFGLEAMVQVTALVLGREGFERLVIEDIRLERPIPVAAEGGERIQLQAVVDEDCRSGTRVRLDIRTARTGFATSHFSATVVVDSKAPAVAASAVAPAKRVPLPLDPSSDLYGPILFQGPRYQRLRTIYELWGEPTGQGECWFEAELGPAVEAKTQSRYLFGDPYFRDSLLQVGQLMIPRDQGLPVFLARLEWSRPSSEELGSRLGYARLEDRQDQHYFGSVVVYGSDGRVLQRLSGHKLRILRHRPELPTARDLSDSGERDSELLLRAMSNALQRFGLDAPAWSVDRVALQGMDRAARHATLLPLLKAAARAHDLARGVRPNGHEPDFSWDDAGKPGLVPHGPGEVPGVSLSHDDDLCVCVVGSGLLGVDVTSIAIRGEHEWLSLLGERKAALARALSREGISQDEAGSIVWASHEAAFKALGSHDIELEHEGSAPEGVKLQARGDGKTCSVVATLVAVTRGPVRALALAHSTGAAAPLNGATRASSFSAPAMSGVVPDAGPEGQPVLSVPLKLGFAEANGLGKDVHFAQYWAFMGRVREQAIEPLLPTLAEALADGKHAWLTNFVEARFYRPVSVGDPLLARFWLERVSGADDSSLAFVFEFSVSNGHGAERVALARMQTTWVDVSPEGAFRASPHPAAFAAFVDRQRPQRAASTEPEWPVSDEARGEVLWRAPAGPGGARQVDELAFETGPEDANFVGNVYFSAYARWQGRLRDRFLHATLGSAPRVGHLDARRVRIEHLREAMPFDKVLVRMLVSRVLLRGIDLRFEYFRLEPNGTRTKLAVAEHEAAWLFGGVEAELPEALRRALLPASGANLLANEV